MSTASESHSASELTPASLAASVFAHAVLPVGRRNPRAGPATAARQHEGAAGPVIDAEDIDMLRLIARSVRKGDAEALDADWLQEFAERLAPHARP